ncbi:hypothetical protein [Pseudoduganella sp. GCM10020061]|uniref:hypothetical protein n=1 Tax=Pseudoduganella sp. GCM10020061 TaxID=3317345 RepID=UPI0036331B6C
MNNRFSVVPIIGIAFTALIAWICIYFWMPTVAYDFFAVYLIAALALVPALLSFRFRWTALGLLGLALTVLGLVAAFSTAPMFRADSYYAMLGTEKQARFNDALPPIDIEQAPLVSQDMALQAMQKRLSEISSLGSQVKVGTPVKQLVRDKLVWVSFLEHGSFFKWYADASTPGYLVVSAHDPADVSLVMELNGAPLKMRYLLSSYFGDRVERRAYMSGMHTMGLTDFEPEIDDNGHPFYIGTTYDHRVGFSGGEATGIAVVDAISGAAKFYKLGTEPAWVDRIQPEEFVLKQMAHRGKYVHGFINLNDEDRMRVDGTLDLVYGSDGRPYWVGGMTSKGTNNGVSGFYFVDSKTKAVRWFKLPSVSQETAAHAVENVNPEKRYRATNPLPFLVNGAPTYVMALRDSQGVARSFGMVDMRNNQVIGVADTLGATLRSYQALRSTNKVSAEVGTDALMRAQEGTVVRIAAEFRNNQTMYYVTLQAADGVLGTIFTGSSDLSVELVLTRPGDKVALSYADSGTRVVAMSKFDNAEIR